MVIRKAFMTSLPVMAGYIVLGTGFGILLRSAGYGTLWALAMSLFIYAGSMQFVGVSLITGAASVLTTAVTTVMINARHLFYSISMISRYKDAGKVKPYLIFALTDETYTLLSDGKIPEGADPDAYRFLVSFFDHCYWVLGSVLGTFAGEFLPFDSTGIEFSMTALFTASFVEQWLSAGSHLPALTSVLSTALCLVLFGPENFLIPSMILITVILSALRGRIATPESRKSDGRREEK